MRFNPLIMSKNVLLFFQFPWCQAVCSERQWLCSPTPLHWKIYLMISNSCSKFMIYVSTVLKFVANIFVQCGLLPNTYLHIPATQILSSVLSLYWKNILESHWNLIFVALKTNSIVMKTDSSTENRRFTKYLEFL